MFLPMFVIYVLKIGEIFRGGFILNSVNKFGKKIKIILFIKIN
jgi:hypothetical protein